MHELSVTQSLIDLILEEVEQRSIKSVKKVGISVGVFTTFEPYAINFYFETLKTEYPPLTDTVLEIELKPGVCRCQECGKDFEVKETVSNLPQCPHCGSIFVEIKEGREFLINYLEV